MRFARIYQTLLLEPWLIQPDAHAGILQLVDSKLGEKAISLNDFMPEVPKFEIDRNNIAIVPIVGPIAKGTAPIERACGVTDVNMVQAQISQAEKAGVDGFMFIVNSPGGTVTGVPELANRIAKLEQPTVAFTEDLMASAAYYLSAGADRIIASPHSANVGSIGVYIPWVDNSERVKAMGLRFDPIIGEKGDLKAIGATPSLSPEHREFLQQRVNLLEENFRNFVTSQRDVKEEGMRGQVLFGNDLVDLGLVDYLALYEDAYDTLLGLTK